MRNDLGLSYLGLGTVSTLATLTYVTMTVLVSATAVHLHTRLLLAISGGLCVSGMLLIAHADSIVTIATGVCAAGLGAAIGPATYGELIPIALESSWRNGAFSAFNADRTSIM